jgi:hypothetical protein|tara:strand:- start:1663 stop:2058 length:396 start_codon:yes stop_codon:yes gene_type:complete
MDMTISVDKLVSTYVKLRDKRLEITSKYKEEEAELREQQDKVKSALLDYCKEHEVDSVRTASGLFYRSVRQRYWTSDWESMHSFIMEHELPEFFEKRLNQTHVRQYLEDNPDQLPPGLNVDSEYTISVRKK